MDEETREALNASTGHELAFALLLRYLLSERLATLPPEERYRVGASLVGKAADPTQFEGMAPTAQLQISLLDASDTMQRVVAAIVRDALKDVQ